MMIMRIFRVKIRPGKNAECEALARQISIPLVQRQRGLLGFYLGKPMQSNPDEFVMITLWSSLADLQAFAGEDWNRPVIPEEATPILERTSLHHYEVFETSMVAA